MFKWDGQDSMVKCRFISYLKARKIISKGSIYHMIRVQDMLSDVPSLESVPIVNEFHDLFPEDHLLHSSKKENLFLA